MSTFEQGLQSVKSPFVVNGQTYEEYMDLNHQGVVARHLERTQTDLSNECKTCIDAGNKWCPTSQYASGYCCTGTDIATCPR